MAMEREKSQEVTYDIRSHLGLICEKQGGWKRELNVVAWNGGDAKFDIRDWSPDHTKMGRGITLTEEEMRNILESYRAFKRGSEKPEAEEKEEDAEAEQV